jgi:hypothetical protein
MCVLGLGTGMVCFRIPWMCVLGQTAALLYWTTATAVLWFLAGREALLGTL